MKKRIACILCLVSLTLSAQGFQYGLKAGLNSSIGTGKGYWDWTTNQDVQRGLTFFPSIGMKVQWEFDSNYALEVGLTYSNAYSLMDVGSDTWVFQHPALELPLCWMFYMRQDFEGPYAKAGPALFYLLPGGEFYNEDSGESLLKDKNPNQRLHLGIAAGLGWQWNRQNLRWFCEFQYSTFYTDPGYHRSDGSRGNIRFHRFELAIGLLL